MGFNKWNRSIILIALFCYALLHICGCATTPKIHDNLELKSFSSTCSKIIPCVVKIYSEISADKVQQRYAAETVVLSDNKPYSIGTGFFITKEGLLVTANHVTAASTGKILVRTQESILYLADVIKSDEDSDIAILKISAKIVNGVPKTQKWDFPHVTLLNPENVSLGTDLGFVGFPLNVDSPFVSRTILSSKAMAQIDNIHPLRKSLQISAFVNHGNSGGPLFLADTGDVIGLINWRPAVGVENQFIDENTLSNAIKMGPIDPFHLSVQLHNKILKYFGDMTQLGIGYCYSIEYVFIMQKDLIKSKN